MPDDNLTSWKLGLVIYAYPLAWASAQVISYRPVFGGKLDLEK
jgi:hypothetical protein